MRIASALFVCILLMAPMCRAQEDPFLWLEDVEGPKALAWVHQQSERTLKLLSEQPEFEAFREESRKIMDSEARIPSIRILGDALYSFWQDAEHPRGIWRRCSFEEFQKTSPKWEIVLDIDRLNRKEHQSWVWKGASCLEPEGRLCMVSLSRGGGDAVVAREFDAEKKSFIEGGFELPEAKSEIGWKDADHLWVATDFGENSLTSSGYPRIVKLWTRGTKLAEAETIFEGEDSDVAVGAYTLRNPDGAYDIISRTPAFFRGEYYLRLADRLVRLDLQEDAALHGIFKDQLLISLRSDWQPAERSYEKGSLLGISLDDFLRGKRDFEILYQPTERSSFAGVAPTRDRLLLATLEKVKGRLTELRFSEGKWTRKEVALPGPGQPEISAVSEFNPNYFFSYSDFLTPESLYLVDAGGEPKRIKEGPEFFDSAGMKVEQLEATSADGTKIPYFLVTPRGFRADGKAPTLLYGYGGFEISMTPFYSGIFGKLWLARGGVLVIANIRGGGEFGPSWHEAALRENRPRAFEDFIAVGEDLIHRKITSHRHLGIMGGSNGGLLVGAVMVLKPDLANAVVCQVPLLDMKRYSHLLAGASWMAEYGNPDLPSDWEFMKTWSPYQNVRKDAAYPEAFFMTSTRDDRVHPGHARKMAAKMMEQGHPVLYFENTEGGHAAAADHGQKAKMTALEMSYLWKKLGADN